ncbi:DUF6311 domain-containing protein [Chelatococcus sp. GCM10030263]|uniref:DUF6311 domain-containing protein n=1 Tax=Chelatococcus sp. GCM10030263 TaxID=3273387 RepID=UPI0036239E75
MRFRSDLVRAIGAYACATALGAALFFWIYSWSYVTGQAPFFDPPAGDAAQALVGANYFLADPWHWSPLKVPQIHPPEGLSIIYTDSVPILALIVKILMGVGSGPVNYVGFWLLICFALQGVGAVYLLRSFGERRLTVLVFGSALFLLTGSFIWRQVAEHFALCGHFMLLFALGLAVRVVRDGRHWRGRAGAFAVLSTVSTLIHPYLGAMVIGCCAIAALSMWIDQRRFWAAALGLTAAFVTTVGVVLILGFNAAGDRGGYGYFSLNLLGPFWPQVSGIFGPHLPIIDATGGQAEGYAYLGAGLLGLSLLALAAIVAKRQRFMPELRSGWTLFVGMAVVYLFAVSSVAYAGHFKLYDLGSVPDLVQTFRSSGRFVWLPLYLGSAAVIMAVARSVRFAALIPILAAALVLQAIDLRPMMAMATGKAEEPRPWSIDRGVWGPLLATHSNLKVLPNYWCGMGSFERAFLELSYLASRYNLPINQARSARRPIDPECRSDFAAISQMALRSGDLVVVPAAAVPAVERAFISQNSACRAFDGGYACSLGWNAITDPEVQSAFRTEPLSMPPGYGRGARISFAANGQGAETQLYGWAGPESFGTWSLQSRAVLLVPVDITNLPQALTFEINAYGSQNVRIQLGESNRHDFQIGGGPEHLTIPLTPNDVSNGALRVTFETPDSKSPSTTGESTDSRVLGVALRSITFD